MPIIDASTMKVPRLELRWRKVGKTWEQRECDYNLVIPLTKYDMRRQDENEKYVRDTHTVRLDSTHVSGIGRTAACIVHEDSISTPFRDCAHANWDSKALGGLPVYAVCGNKAYLVEYPAEAATVTPSDVMSGTKRGKELK